MSVIESVRSPRSRGGPIASGESGQPGGEKAAGWKALLPALRAMSPLSPVDAAPVRQPYFLFFSIQAYGSQEHKIRPVILPTAAFLASTTETAPLDRAALLAFLEHNPAISEKARYPDRVLAAGACLNAAPALVEFANLLTRLEKMSGVYYLYAQMQPSPGDYLDILSRLDADLYYGTALAPLATPLRFAPGRVEAQLYLQRDDQGVRASARLLLGTEALEVRGAAVQALSHNPAWLLLGDQVARYKDGPDQAGQAQHALLLLRHLPVYIPLAEEPAFVEEFLLPVAQQIAVAGDELRWENIAAKPAETPKKRLYLLEEDGKLKLHLAFVYDEIEIPYTLADVAETIRYKQNGSWTLVRIQRAVEAERSVYAALSSTRYGLKRDAAVFGAFSLRANLDPVDFLLRKVPLLAADGFEIFGEETLKQVRVNRHPPKLRWGVETGLDWFDLRVQILFGDTPATLQEVKRALRKKTRFVKLVDGSIGELPPEWIEAHQRLFNLGTAMLSTPMLSTAWGETIRYTHTQVGLLQHLDDAYIIDEGTYDDQAHSIREDGQTASVNAAFWDRLRRYKDGQASSVPEDAPRPLPAGFSGQLRPYQQAGFEWMWFLRENQFGGCLADDMGLGKTVQVLVFLQSLKEMLPGPLTHLIVVPRSLLVNWQREIEKFTPGLSAKVYFGGGRARGRENLANYDIVLTTYGTMRRDIQFLRGQTFEYIILDESQAIKNPNAQVSKAARLLRAAFRLAMTGTPVENSAVELWSQFAFLNPGMLGTLPQFQQAFVLPIEKKKDEQAAALLRSLIQPFVLRRTKEWVAPELPARNERIVYCDLEPAQSKLYTQTRDFYRKQLLGMIAENGLDRARLHVLEGLLRLRQICDHPRLVDPNAKSGSAKLEFLLETLETLFAEGHKALVFSQFVQMLQLVRAELDRHKIPYAYLDGQTYNRAQQIDAFQTDPTIPFFLISLKAGGVGLNLTAADYVIHLDPWWNPAVEMQATDRTHRIGQDKPVFVYKLIARQTVEEKILALQERKMALVRQMVSTEDQLFKSLDVDDIQMLFS